VFDLKGSTVDRLVKGKTKPETTLKDMNFIKYSDLHHRKRGFPLINLRDVDVKRVIFSLRKDVAFLKSQELMDYSLLLVIERRYQNEITGVVGDDRFSISQEEREAGSSSLIQDETLIQKDFSKFLKKKHSFTNGNRVYHIAIIDYLQEWNLNKKTERFLKTMILLKDGK
jgi:hypothetical protein